MEITGSRGTPDGRLKSWRLRHFPEVSGRSKGLRCRYKERRTSSRWPREGRSGPGRCVKRGRYRVLSWNPISYIWWFPGTRLIKGRELEEEKISNFTLIIFVESPTNIPSLRCCLRVYKRLGTLQHVYELLTPLFESLQFTFLFLFIKNKRVVVIESHPDPLRGHTPYL